LKKARVETSLGLATPYSALRNDNGTCHFTRQNVYLKWQLVVATSSELTLFRNHRLLIEQTIKLSRTEPNLGGVRWWYLCPDCGGRVAYLYLPQTAHRFSCRKCHNLTYESTQSSHSAAERHYQRLACEIGCNTREARLLSHLTNDDGAVTDIQRPRINKVRRRRTVVGREIEKLVRKRRLAAYR
jgi:hypothetical protein